MKHVIIGAGPAGIVAAKTIRELRPQDEITIVSTDDKVHSRCMLHKIIGKERDEAAINFVEDSFFEDSRIAWESGKTVQKVCTDAKEIILESGEKIQYDKLLIATGAKFAIPPLPNFKEAKNVYGLRDLPDAVKIREAAGSAKQVVIIGSGLVGMDAAYGLLERGIKPVIVEMADRILPLQLDENGSKRYQKLFEDAGCTFKLGIGAKDSTMDAAGNLTEITLSNGETLPCDFVIVAAGVRPAIGFLEGSGIQAERAVQVNDRMESSANDVYAAGDAAGLSGIWPNAMKQGQTAAYNMCGVEKMYVDKFAFKNTINFFGLVTLSLGVLSQDEGCEAVVREDRRIYQKALIKDNKLKAILMMGDIDYSGIYQYLIKQEVDLGRTGKSVFDLSFADFYGFDGEDGSFYWNAG